jgi:glycerol-3-phosphate acyltransferase PlsY
MPESYPLHLAIAAMIAYAIGATPFGYVIARARGVDIRQHGSGNIGATNVLRVLGKRFGIPVFILDVLKGLVPVIVCRLYCDSHIPADAANREDLLAIANVVIGISTILGHNYTFWLGFKGGKGIATSAGAMLGIMPVVLIVAMATWLILFFSTRYVAVASIAASIIIPFAVLALGWIHPPLNMPNLVLGILMGFFGVWRHRSNIRRLRDGTEARFHRRQKPRTPPSHP